MSDELEPLPKARAIVAELRELADFIEAHPELAEGRTMPETIAAASEAMADLDAIPYAEPDDFE